MSKYLTSEILHAAFLQLGRLTDKPEKQGQTQFTSILRYVAALDAFKKRYRRDCDTRAAKDKEKYTALVGDVVALGDGFYTSNFYTNFLDDDDFKVGSNFYSANLVPKTELQPKKNFDYPKRNAPVFQVRDRILLVESIMYENIANYLHTKSLKCAFVTWLLRKHSFPDTSDNLSFNDALRSAICEHYTEQFRDAIWGKASFSIEDLSVESGLEAFGDVRASLTHEGLYSLRIPAAPTQSCGTIERPHNLIFFGAPGTGKSFNLNKEACEHFPVDNIRRVTFHPDYTYSQFVGCFKPFTSYVVDHDKPLSEMKSEISYRYVPGPFLETYMKAVQNPSEPYLLVIEEINRANPAAVFGDVFQLLDRGEDGASEYDVATPVEMREYLQVFLPEYASSKVDKGSLISDRVKLTKMAETLSLPSNMYIWATMNSADQGVFPMDTAFKRRWDFEYMDINDEDAVAVIGGYSVPLGKTGKRANWNDFRVAINDVLRLAKVNEDKWLGPFFVKPAALKDDSTFRSTFKDKVLLYLYEDAAKTKRQSVFSDPAKTYYELCELFDTDGEGVFVNMDNVGFVSDGLADVGDDGSAE